MNFRRLTLITIVTTEIALGGIFLYSKYASILKKTTDNKTRAVTKVPKDMLNFRNDSYLKHFYEPKPFSVEQDNSNWLVTPITYRHNSMGIRSDEEYTIDKPNSTFRILALGDSFTWGQGVRVEDTYAQQLEKILNSPECDSSFRFEVINLGVTSYDIQYTVEHFSKLGLLFKPDLIVWLINQHNIYQLRELLTPLEEKIYKETSESAKQKFFSENNFYFAASEAQRQIDQTLGIKKIFSIQTQALRIFANTHQGQFALFMFPWSSEETKNVITSFTKEYGRRAYFSDSLPDLNRISGALLTDGHPSARGHKLISQNMYRFLRTNNLVACVKK